MKAFFAPVNVDFGFGIECLEIVAFATDGETSVIDPVGEAPDNGSEDAACECLIEIGVGKCDVGEITFPVGRFHGDEQSPVFSNAHLGVVSVCQGENVDGSSVRHFSPFSDRTLLCVTKLRGCEQDDCCTGGEMRNISHMRMLPFSLPTVNRGMIVASTLALPFFLTAADWPNHRGPDFDGISKEKGLQTSCKAEVAWTAEVGLGYSTPVISGGSVFVSGHDGNDKDTVFCIDAGNGTVKWEFSYPQSLADLYFQGGTTGTPTVEGGRVYQIAREGEVFCLDAANGNVIWQKHLQKDFGYSKPTWGFTGSALLLGPAVLINAGEAGIALRKDDGGVIWQSEDEEAGYSTPVALEKGDKTYILFSNKRYYICVEMKTGNKVWEYKWMTRYGVNAADPILSGDQIFISSGYGKGATLIEWKGEGDPERIWQNREMKTQMNSAILIDGYLYGIDGNESQGETGLKCLEMSSGEAKWLVKDVGHGTVIAVEGNLLVLTEQGELQVAPVAPSEYKPTFTQQVIKPRVWTVPVFANGIVYCRNAGGSLVAVEMKKKS